MELCSGAIHASPSSDVVHVHVLLMMMRMVLFCLSKRTPLINELGFSRYAKACTAINHTLVTILSVYNRGDPSTPVLGVYSVIFARHHG